MGCCGTTAHRRSPLPKHLSGSGAKLPNRRGEAALEATLNHQSIGNRDTNLGFQNFVTASESHTKLKEEGDNPTHVRNGRTHNIAALHNQSLWRGLSRNHVALQWYAWFGSLCVWPPLLSDLRGHDAVLNPTDLYSVSFVKQSHYRDARCRLGSFSPLQYRIAHRRRSGGDE